MAVVPSRVSTVVAGSIAKSADFNAEASAGNFALFDRPIVKVRQFTAQTLQTATLTPIVFDTVDVDNDGTRTGVGSSTDRLICRTTGWYSIMGVVVYPQTGTGSRMALLYVNSAAVDGFFSTDTATTANVGVSVSGLVHLMAGDVVQLNAYQDSGATITTPMGTGGQHSTLTAFFMLAG